jgi:WD40 repeat protein
MHHLCSSVWWRCPCQVWHLVSGAQHDLAGHTDQVLALAAANNCLFSGGKDMSIRVWSFDMAAGTFAPSVRACSGSPSYLYWAHLACMQAGTFSPSVRACSGSLFLLMTHLMALACMHARLAGGLQGCLMILQCGVDAQVVITAAQGGHTAPVQALLPFGQWLVSADWLGNLKVWDMASGACAQTIQRAHTDLIMGLLAWDVRSFPSLPATCPVLNSVHFTWGCCMHILRLTSAHQLVSG